MMHIWWPICGGADIAMRVTSATVSRMFLKVLMTRSALSRISDFIPLIEGMERPVTLAKALLEDVYTFEFRSSANERFKGIQECGDMSGFFIPPAMLRYHASDPTIRRAIVEYEDDLEEPINDGEERVSGYYT